MLRKVKYIDLHCKVKEETYNTLLENETLGRIRKKGFTILAINNV